MTRNNIHPKSSSKLTALFKTAWQKSPYSYLIATVCTFLTTAIIYYTHADASIANPPMLYLLDVQIIALFSGSRAAIFASLLSLLEFDWFFVDPKYQFTVRDPFEFTAFGVFLITAITFGQLTTLLKRRAHEAHKRELEAKALAQASWTVASESNSLLALQKVINQLSNLNNISQSLLFLWEPVASKYEIVASYSRNSKILEPTDLNEIIKTVVTTQQSIGWESGTPENKNLIDTEAIRDIYLPVTVETKVIGAWYIQLNAYNLPAEDTRVIESLLNHIVVVIHRDQLIQAQAHAQAIEEADRLKTTLLQMVSHDFRSPLASTKAVISSLLVDSNEPIDHETLHTMLHGVDQDIDRLNKMVGNILDLSRLEAGAWKPKREMIAVTDLVGATLDSFTTQDSKRIQTTINCQDLEIFVDLVQIIQVLHNLLENALKYSPPDTLVSLVVKSEKNLQIEIIDHGPGLPDTEKIFAPFFRAPEHQESAIAGLGMGLAICRGLIEAHNGLITAYNSPSGGAIFCVTLPLTVGANNGIIAKNSSY